MANISRTFSLVQLLKKSVSELHVTSTQLRLQSTKATKLVYSEFGDPIKVIQRIEEPIADIKPNQVLVQMLAAPINPADINTIQGKYPERPALPAVAGNEGVGVVTQLGDLVKEVSLGDHVVPLKSGIGTWSSHIAVPVADILSVPKTLGLVEAATLIVNPCTANRMLRDFTELKPGDTVIQNGANSSCGQYVIQICRVWGIKTVNIVRDRPDIANLKTFLKNLGATEVLTEEELRKTEIFKSGELQKPRLALNCVGGKSALEIMRRLENGSPMVTYGGMSREPVTVPTSALIFKDIQVRGFWMTVWSKKNGDSVERFEMFDELISMMKNKELHGPAYEMVDFENYKDALINTMTIKGMTGKKFILGFKAEK